MKILFHFFFFAGLVFSLNENCAGPPDANSEVVIYGATPSGIMAAISAARVGSDVVLLEATDHVGGIVTNGLTIADLIKRNAFGGLFDEYLQRIVKQYEITYGANSEQVKQCMNGEQPEPHVTELVFNQMLDEHPQIKVYLNHRLKKVIKKGNAIVEVVMENLSAKNAKANFSGKVFIDATYEGDLAAFAGAKYRVGRESRQEFGEPHAGFIYTVFHTKEYLPGTTGEGDNAIQAYCFRLSMTKEPGNKVEVQKPEVYDRKDYTHLIEDIKAGRLAPLIESNLIDRNTLAAPIQLWQKPNNKVEVNSENMVNGAPKESSDLAEENWAYPEASYAKREKIFNRYKNYQIGLIWFLQHDEEIPLEYRQEALKWGFSKDEFVTNNNFPRQMYVRQGRRIIGEYFLTQLDGDIVPEMQRTRLQPSSIAIAEYPFDSHACHKWNPEQPAAREGYIYIMHDPFQIPFGAIVPKTIDNLLVPVSLSASHVAYQAVRMEPLFMCLGQAAGLAAHLAIRNSETVRNIDTKKLQQGLIGQGAIVTYLEDVEVGDPDRKALQFFATYTEMKGYKVNPDSVITQEQAKSYLKLIIGNSGISDQQKLKKLNELEIATQNIVLRDFAKSVYASQF